MCTTDMSMHLLSHPKIQNGIRYCYYSLAQSFREEGRVKKRVVASLGKLSDEQAETIRQTLRVKNDPNYQLIHPSEITCESHSKFLDVSVFHQLWRELHFDGVIEKGTGELDLCTVLEILVLNRCCEPKSKSGVARWFSTTALTSLLNVESATVNESRLYRSLSMIEAQHEVLENHLFKYIAQKQSTLYFYDLSSSYFEGDCVAMAAINGHSKDHRPDRLQVVLGLLINEEGLPFSWDIFRGNQSDAPTLKLQLKKFQTRFQVKDAICVFDRGFLSQDNLKLVEEAGYHYVTGLDAPQIETLLHLKQQDWLLHINTDTCEETALKQPRWKRFDETQFYLPIGVIDDRQTILLFDTARYRKTIFERQEKIDAFKIWASKHNEWLAGFKKHAQKTAIEHDIDQELQKRNLTPFISYQLHDYITQNKTFVRRKNNPFPSQGYMKNVHSFQIVIRENNRRILDGVFALISSQNAPLTPEAVIQAYRQKYLIEAAFREMKSVLKLRPWFVYKEEHVKAHYTICVLAYFLERLLDLKLEQAKLKDEGLTLIQLKDELKKIHLIHLALKGKSHTTLQVIPNNLRATLQKLGLKKALQLPL